MLMDIITAEDRECLVSYLERLETKHLKESKKLAEAASHGGSFPSFTPEYQSLEFNIHTLGDEIQKTKKIINESEIINLDDLSESEAAPYQVVSIENVNSGEISELYVIDPQIVKAKNIKTDLQTASPGSPIVKQLLGKRVGDLFVVILPQGEQQYKLISLKKHLIK
jgi:transcription elongation GreA/GreB family factor